MTADLAPDYTGTLANTGTVSSPTPDPNPVNNSATATAGQHRLVGHLGRQDDEPDDPGPGCTDHVQPRRPQRRPVHRGGGRRRRPAERRDRSRHGHRRQRHDLHAGRWQRAQLPASARSRPNGDVTVTVTGTLAADFTGQLTNTATADSPTADPDTSNNSSTVTGVAAPSADVSVTKSLAAGPARARPAGDLHVTVTNAGPSAASAVVVTDQVSPSLTGVVASTTAGSCAVSDQNLLTCTVGAVEPGATVHDHGARHPGRRLHRHAVQHAPPSARRPPTRTRPTTRPPPTAPAPRRPTCPSSSAPTRPCPVPGETVTYTLAVHNDGPSAAASATVTDQLDAALVGATARTTVGSCTVSATNAVSCALGALAPEADASVTISATLAAGLHRHAVQHRLGRLPDRRPGRRPTTATPSPATPRPSADVSITKSMTPANPVPGQEVTYTLTVDNAGPSTATGVTVADQLDPALTGATATTTAGTCAIDADQPPRLHPRRGRPRRRGGHGHRHRHPGRRLHRHPVQHRDRRPPPPTTLTRTTTATR